MILWPSIFLFFSFLAPGETFCHHILLLGQRTWAKGLWNSCKPRLWQLWLLRWNPKLEDAWQKLWDHSVLGYLNTRTVVSFGVLCPVSVASSQHLLMLATATKGRLVWLKEAVLLQSLRHRLWGGASHHRIVEVNRNVPLKNGPYFHSISSKVAWRGIVCQVDSVTDGDGTLVSDGDVSGSVIGDAIDGEVVGDGLKDRR